MLQIVKGAELAQVETCEDYRRQQGKEEQEDDSGRSDVVDGESKVIQAGFHRQE